MSNSQYADINSNTSADTESVTFAPIDGEELTENPFSSANHEMEPLHALDAARRLLGEDSGDDVDNDAADDAPFAFGASNASIGSVGSGSLLERIQKQKRQQQPVASTAPPQGSDHQFGYPMAEDTTNYSYASSALDPASQPGMSVRVPDYSTSSNAVPGPYANDAPSADYKEQMFNVLSAVGGAANSAAKSAYRGTRKIYGNVMSQRGAAGGASAQVRMTEMDYQRESLLMDPHDLEASGIAGAAIGPGADSHASTAPMGLRAGMDSGDSTVASGGYAIVGYAKQFCVDVKDIFLAASPRVQLIVAVLVIFILWLFISEEF